MCGSSEPDVLCVFMSPQPPDDVARSLQQFVARMHTRRSLTSSPTAAADADDVMSPVTPRQRRRGQGYTAGMSSWMMTTPTPGRRRGEGAAGDQANSGGGDADVFQSSAIKYCMSQPTPFFKRCVRHVTSLMIPVNLALRVQISTCLLISCCTYTHFMLVHLQPYVPCT